MPRLSIATERRNGHPQQKRLGGTEDVHPPTAVIAVQGIVNEPFWGCAALDAGTLLDYTASWVDPPFLEKTIGHSL